MDPIRFEHWQAWQQEGCTWLPAARVFEVESRPQTWSAFFQEGTPAVLLESALGGRYTYLCDRAQRVALGDVNAAEVRSCGGTNAHHLHGAPIEVVRQLNAQRRAPKLPNWPAMSGGLMGVFGYDVIRTWERLPLSAQRDVQVPLYALIEPRDLFIFDANTGKLGVVSWVDVSQSDSDLEAAFADGEARVGQAYHRWSAAKAKVASGPAVRPAESAHVPASSFTPSGFQAAVRRAQEYIAAGDTYQVNLSLRTSRSTQVRPVEMYDALKRVNPSPYMGLLQLPEFALVCGSPELLVRLVDGVISSRPIAGTRPRGAMPTADSALSAELFASEKERAEHLMLVDLIRNDIGRVAEFGSVEVREFMVLERYSHVMHIVSQVEGRLAADKTWADAFQSMFPGGTITGCPKMRTMEIIEELEPVGRGYYTGALGWLGYHGDMEFNIVIRSMLMKDGVAHVQAGAGIVADSQPERELDEALRKAEALWVALDQLSDRRS